jgi:two-component system cell cycle sensor histidine kinase/response regulator CckA
MGDITRMTILPPAAARQRVGTKLMPDALTRPAGTLLPEGIPVSLLLELLRHVPACVGLYTPEGTCLAASDALARWLERSPETIVGRDMESLWPDDFARQQKEKLAETLRRGTVAGIEEFPALLGRTKVRVVRFAWSDEGGQTRGVVEIFEEQPAVVSRAETVGRLALGIAHDFNNALTLVLGQADLLERAVRHGEPLTPALAELRQGLNHACQLPRQLLCFVRDTALTSQLLDLNTLLISLEGLVRPRLRPGLGLRLELAPGGAWVEGEPVQLTQVLLNLTLNALEAMPNGGVVVLRSDRLDSAVRLTISDTGVGMSAEVQRRLFEPLFTTRAAGTGLGLFLVREIVERHGGWLSCRSEPGKGTVFTLELPVRHQPGTDPGLAQRTRVLLVERDPDIRRLTGVILAQDGYEPILCGSLEEARRQAERPSAPIRVLLLDAELCARRGEGERRLQGMLPGAAVVYLTTGQAMSGSARQDVVTKPFRAEQLLEAIRAALSAARAGV